MKPSAVGKAIVGVCRALSEEGIAKSHQNQDDGYSFRSVDDVYRALSPLLVEHGLVILPSVLERKVTVRPAQGGRAVSCVSLAVKYTIVSANDGSKFEVVVHGEAMDASDKGTNKAMQAAYKYMAFQTFCIPVAGEEDADSVTLELAPDESSQRSRPRRSGNFGKVAAGIVRCKTSEEVDALKSSAQTLTPEEKEWLRPIWRAVLDRIANRTAAEVPPDDAGESVDGETAMPVDPLVPSALLAVKTEDELPTPLAGAFCFVERAASVQTHWRIADVSGAEPVWRQIRARKDNERLRLLLANHFELEIRDVDPIALGRQLQKVTT